MNKLKETIYSEYYTKRIGRDTPKTLLDLERRRPFYENLIKRFIPKTKTLKILELGCGCGALQYFLVKAGYTNIRGIDNSRELVSVAQNLKIQNIVQADIYDYLRKCEHESIDVLVMIDVLEHFSKEELFELIPLLYRVLRDNGSVITHLPNAESPFGLAVRYGDITHENAFTRVSISQLFLSSGFSSIKSYEDTPIVHGFKSAIRLFLWKIIVRPVFIFILIVESGGVDKNIIFSKNFTSVVKK